MRALSPDVGATLAIGGEPFKVWRARALVEDAPAPLVAEGGRLVASAGEGSLELLELQPPAGGRMEAAAFLRGWRGPPRDRGRPVAEAPNGIAPERSVALRVLRRVDDGAYADRALAAEARRAHLDPRTRAQATRLAYGAVQRRRTLDWLIDGALDRPASLEPAVRDILRIGAYELAFSDGVPARAAVDQAVRQARALRGPKARASARAGVVNAVLRRIADEGPALLAELDAGGPETAGVRHSMPDWIAERLVASLGEADAVAVMEAAAAPAESALRWNPLRGPREELEAELPAGWRRDPLVPDAYVLSAPFALEESRAWARGLAMGQSRASQLVRARRRSPARRAGARPLRRPRRQDHPHGGAGRRRRAHHGRGAAPGPRGGRCASSRTAWGPTSRWWRGTPARCRSRAATTRCWWIRPAPGSGSCRRGPTPAGAVARRRSGHSRAQRGLLERALGLARPGGRVVYSTCTLIAEENEEVVEAAGAPLDDLGAASPGLAHPRRPEALLTLPHRHGTDGFFIARMRVA